MKRKVYEKPEITVVEMQHEGHILAGSDPTVNIGGSNLKPGDGDPDDFD